MKNHDFSVRIRFQGSDVSEIAIGSISGSGARAYQEDSFGFSSVEAVDVSKYGLTAVVADGMGGVHGGKVISAYTVSAVLERLKERDPSAPLSLYLSNLLKVINSDVHDERIAGGTTAAIVTCVPEGVFWATVGDSRVYLYRNRFLTMLNEDSDYFNRLLEEVIAGKRTYNDAFRDPKKDALAEYIGYKGKITPDGNLRPLIPVKDDRILICSDGVYNALETDELSEALSQPAMQSAAFMEQKIVAKNYSNQDNFTAVVLEFK